MNYPALYNVHSRCCRHPSPISYSHGSDGIALLWWLLVHLRFLPLDSSLFASGFRLLFSLSVGKVALDGMEVKGEKKGWNVGNNYGTFKKGWALGWNMALKSMN